MCSLGVKLYPLWLEKLADKVAGGCVPQISVPPLSDLCHMIPKQYQSNWLASPRIPSN